MVYCTVWVKKVAPPKNFFCSISLAVNLHNWNLRGRCPTVSAYVPIWSIHLNIYMNSITLTSKTPKILTIQFSLLQNSQTFFFKNSYIMWHLTKYNCQFPQCELSCYIFKISAVADTCLQSLVVAFHSMSMTLR